MRSLGTHLGRAVSSALLVVLLSLAFHLLGGGHAPPVTTILVLWGLSTLAAAPLSRRQLRPAGLLTLLGLAQVGLHLGFEAGSGHGTHAAPLPMIATHVIATALTALVIRYGRAVLRHGLDRYTRRRLLRPAAVPSPAQLPVPVSRQVPTPAPGTGAVMGRAPPLLVRS